MEQHDHRNPAPAAHNAAPRASLHAQAATPPRACWTPAKQRIFLVALMECGGVAPAARAAGMSRSSAHRLRARLAGTPFDRAWSLALEHHARRMADPFANDRAATTKAAKQQ